MACSYAIGPLEWARAAKAQNFDLEKDLAAQIATLNRNQKLRGSRGGRDKKSKKKRNKKN